jgi:geranylgeranyl reductase family protein
MKMYDVVVVGAGPAGSTAAYYIDGLKTLIIDRYDFPRHKACGGGLMSARDWHLEFENFAKIESKIESVHSNNTFRMYWNKTFVTARRFKHFFDQVSRSEFDHLLLKEALAKENVTFQKFTLQSMRRETINGKNGYVLSDGEQEFFALFVIGADGMLSKVGEFLGNKSRKRHQYGICLEYDIECEKITNDVIGSTGWGYEIGYSWIFPTKKGYYVGVGMVREPREITKQYLDRYLAWSVEKGWIPKDYTITRTFGSVIPLKVVKQYCSDGVMLCGDAMGTVSILIGEGIYFAMKSGKIAGQTLSVSTENIRKRYRKDIRPVVKAVSLTPYIPPKIMTLSFFTVFFMLWKVIDRFNFAKVNALVDFLTRGVIHRFMFRKTLHREPGQKGSYYADEKIEWVGESVD